MSDSAKVPLRANDCCGGSVDNNRSNTSDHSCCSNPKPLNESECDDIVIDNTNNTTNNSINNNSNHSNARSSCCSSGSASASASSSSGYVLPSASSTSSASCCSSRGACCVGIRKAINTVTHSTAGRVILTSVNVCGFDVPLIAVAVLATLLGVFAGGEPALLFVGVVGVLMCASGFAVGQSYRSSSSSTTSSSASYTRVSRQGSNMKTIRDLPPPPSRGGG